MHIYELGKEQVIPSSVFVPIVGSMRKAPFTRTQVIVISSLKIKCRLYVEWLRFLTKYHLPIFLVLPHDLMAGEGDDETAHYLSAFMERGVSGYIGAEAPADSDKIWYPTVESFETEWSRIARHELDDTVRYPHFKDKYEMRMRPCTEVHKAIVFFHAYDMDVMRFIARDYPVIRRLRCIITTDSAGKEAIIRGHFDDPSLVDIIVVPNKGTDIYPFWRAMEHAFAKRIRAEYIIKVHTKSCPKWRNELMSPLFNSLDEVIKNLDETPEVDMAFSKLHAMKSNTMNPTGCGDIVRIFAHCNPILMCLLERNGHNPCDPFLYCAGTIFISRFHYFEEFYYRSNMQHYYDYFEDTVQDILLPNMLHTRTWTHAWEEFICKIAVRHHGRVALL